MSRRRSSRRRCQRRRSVLIRIALIVGISALFVLPLSYGYFWRVGRFGEDYHFDGDRTIETETGWTATLMIWKPFNISGRVLGQHYYYVHAKPEDPTSVFSPVDVFIGTEMVAANPDTFGYRIERYDDREVFCTIESSADYFRAHTSNLHLIGANRPVAEALLDLRTGDWLTVYGRLVNVHIEHESGDRWGDWSTDDEVGNAECEIVLVDALRFNGRLIDENSTYAMTWTSHPALTRGLLVWGAAGGGAVGISLAAYFKRRRR